MAPAFRVFLVEDEPMMRELIETILADDCLLTAFASAEACLQALEHQLPDMFLLDIRLPGIDGHELCRRIKAAPRSQGIPVTFISAYDTIEHRMAGYEAGGEDFIVKPFQPNELLRKVQVARRIIDEKRRWQEAAGAAQRTAFSAMTTMGELGVVLDFLRKSFACTTGAELAQTILQTLDEYGLRTAVQVRLGRETNSLSAEGTDLPLETSILNHVRNQGRIFDFKNRSVYNFGGITLMVKNMPTADVERCGRIRDNLAILAEGADARRQAIEIEAANHRTRRGIGGALAEIQSALETLRQNHQREQFHGTQVMVEVQEALVKSFVALGLTEQQENFVIDIVRQYFDRMRDQLDHGHGVSHQLERLAQSLRTLAAE